MSETTEGATDAPHPGWWKASDGNWYPPQPETSTLPPQPPGAAPTPTGPAPSNGASTAALVVGIISLLLFWAFGIGAVVGIVAIILGIKGTKAAARHPSRPGNGAAIAGIVTGAIGIFLSLTVGAIVVITFLGSEAEQEFERIGEELDGGINSDPADGVCNEDRYYQDPDC